MALFVGAIPIAVYSGQWAPGLFPSGVPNPTGATGGTAVSAIMQTPLLKVNHFCSWPYWGEPERAPH